MSDVKMPQLGETVAEGTVAKWFKQRGDNVTKGEALFEVSTDKVDTEIPAQTTGVLTQILVEEGQTVDVGTVLAVITTDGETDEADVRAPAPKVQTITVKTDVTSSPKLASSGALQLSPVVRKLLAQYELEPANVVGTGPNGRITKDDVIAHVASATTVASESTTQSPVVRRLLEEHGLDASSIRASSANGRLTRRDVEEHIASLPPTPQLPSNDTVVPFTRLRKLTAEHMVRSKATSAHTLMVREVDYESVELVRSESGAVFKEKEGFSLTYLPFSAMATLLALREFPYLNASVGNDELIVHNAINLGIAVDLNNEGLVVPVIRAADELSLRGLARSINKAAKGARDSTLGVDDFSGGTFTITNPGPFGTLITGAIINQPQVAILSTDTVTRRPVVVTNAQGEESMAIHSTGLLALTFDHRAVDGAYAARFLQRIATILAEEEGTLIL
jgi:2-oxoglutarate dehydrogenase E2 component (dihydrolipoamide succinyltransferase)